jgi:hypothetical protein
VRLARDLGDLSLLLPDGVHDIYDMPYPLFEAIRLALIFLNYEELPSEEQPPRSIWFENDEMRKHWKAVERMRKKKYGGAADDDIGDEPIVGPVSENAAMKELIDNGGR